MDNFFGKGVTHVVEPLVWSPILFISFAVAISKMAYEVIDFVEGVAGRVGGCAGGRWRGLLLSFFRLFRFLLPRGRAFRLLCRGFPISIAPPSEGLFFDGGPKIPPPLPSSLPRMATRAEILFYFANVQVGIRVDLKLFPPNAALLMEVKFVRTSPTGAGYHFSVRRIRMFDAIVVGLVENAVAAEIF